MSFPSPLHPWGPSRQGPGGIGLTTHYPISHIIRSSGTCPRPAAPGGGGEGMARPMDSLVLRAWTPCTDPLKSTQQELAGAPLQQTVFLGELCLFKSSCLPTLAPQDPKENLSLQEEWL